MFTHRWMVLGLKTREIICSNTLLWKTTKNHHLADAVMIDKEETMDNATVKVNSDQGRGATQQSY